MNLSENMDRIKPVIEKLHSSTHMTTFNFLEERIDYPESFVTMLGETSSGKSTIINGLLKEEFLYTAARPASGTIVELYEMEAESKITRYAVLKDAKLRKLSANQFNQENSEPSEEVLRLRLNIPEMPLGLNGMRLFDTPGYGSIYEQHEEVLKEFIPNSDVIIYVVNYRVGIGESDAEFLNYISTYLQNDVTFFLVINRVPDSSTEDDSRIKEITRHTKDILHDDIEYFIIDAIPGDSTKLPESLDLWNAVRREIKSPTRQNRVNDVLFDFQKQLLDQAAFEWQEKLAYYQTTNTEKDLLVEEIEKLRTKKEQGTMLINQTFDKINQQLPTMFSKASDIMQVNISAEIQDSGKWTSATECMVYIEKHLLPRYEKLERIKIEDYLEQELTILDEKLQELVNTAIVNFSRELEIISNSFEPIVEGLMQKTINHVSDGALKGFLAKFGGRGGAGAGMANLGKKGLKHFGKLFGKTFTREQHNNFAKFLSKVGATSTRRMSIAISLSIESLFYVIEVHRWQNRAVNDTEKTITNWEVETLKTLSKDINELRKINLTSLDELFEEFFTLFDNEEIYSDSEEPDLLKQHIIEIQQLKNDLIKEEILQ